MAASRLRRSAKANAERLRELDGNAAPLAAAIKLQIGIKANAEAATLSARK